MLPRLLDKTVLFLSLNSSQHTTPQNIIPRFHTVSRVQPWTSQGHRAVSRLVSSSHLDWSQPANAIQSKGKETRTSYTSTGGAHPNLLAVSLQLNPLRAH